MPSRKNSIIERAFGPGRRKPGPGRNKLFLYIAKMLRRVKAKFSNVYNLLRWASVGIIWGAIITFVLLIYYLHDLPDTEKLTKTTGNYQIKLISADGKLITTLGNLYGDDLRYESIPSNLINAVVATEDRRFFKHFGFDVFGFTRAMVTNARAGRVVQGGSTITQQLAKIVFLSPERTVKRKIQELLLAFWLEYKYTKKEILTLYLNRVYMGAGYFGVDAAARGYFGKPTSMLTLNESAMLAGLLKAPSRYSPFSNKEIAQKRANQVITNMIDAGYLTVKDAMSISNVVQTKAPRSDSRFYFSDWLASEIPDYVGIVDSDLEVITTLDMRLQKFADDAINATLTEHGDALDARQASLVSLSPRGEVLAMVGGRDYKQSQFNRATQALRQPGSSFKLFVYLAGIEAGYRPGDTFEDKEIDIDGWMPKNWNNEYQGNVTLKEAFAMSINSVAVQLAESVGRERVVEMAQRLGITTPVLPIASLALGTNEVSLLEMTQAYAHLPNEGMMVRAYGIKEIRKTDGTILYQRMGSLGTRVLEKATVAKMNVFTKAVMEEGTGRKSRLLRDTAGKSGTTQDFRDAWFIGYTPQVVTGVWIGNDDNSPMDGVTGGSLAGQIWKKFMYQTHENINPLSIPTSVGWIDWLDTEWANESDESNRRVFWDRIMDNIEIERETDFQPGETSPESSNDDGEAGAPIEYR